MSQYPYPPPYTPPTPNFFGPGFVPAPPAARSAATLTLILGILLLVFGTCFGAAFWIVPLDPLVTEMQNRGVSFTNAAGWSAAEILRALGTVMCSISFLIGLTLSILSIFVRRAGRISAICAAVITGLLGLFLVLEFLATLLQFSADPVAGVFGVLLVGSILLLCIATFIRLIAALRTGGQNQNLALQQMQYWMMMQQGAATYNPAGGYHGYPPPPPPAPQPQAPPPAPQPPQEPPQA